MSEGTDHSQIDWRLEKAANSTGKQKWKMPRNLPGYLFLAPAIIYLVLVSIYPLISTVQMSFTDVEEGHWYFVGLQNYAALLKDPWFWNSINIIIVFTGATVILHISIGMIFALLLNENWFSITLRNVLRGILILSWVFSTAATSLMWSLLYHPYGLLNYFTTALLNRSTPIEYLGDPSLALWSIVAVSAWKGYPFYMMIILGGLQAIPLELYEAAKVDGANIWQRFCHITIPQIRPILVAITAIDIIGTFSAIDLINMLTKGGPLRTTETVAYYLYYRGIVDGNLGYGAAISTLMMGLLAVFMVIYMRLLYRGGEIGEKSL